MEHEGKHWIEWKSEAWQAAMRRAGVDQHFVNERAHSIERTKIDGKWHYSCDDLDFVLPMPDDTSWAD